jgi:hypothetical protein
MTVTLGRIAGLSRAPPRRPASRVRRAVLGLQSVEKSFGPCVARWRTEQDVEHAQGSFRWSK